MPPLPGQAPGTSSQKPWLLPKAPRLREKPSQYSHIKPGERGNRSPHHWKGHCTQNLASPHSWRLFQKQEHLIFWQAISKCPPDSASQSRIPALAVQKGLVSICCLYMLASLWEEAGRNTLAGHTKTKVLYYST